ncbi:hypothetical protein ACX83E_00315 [Burkholderia pseudomallei]
MKSLLRCCFAITAVLLAPGVLGRPALTAYFIPFSVSTYVPITVDNIACMAWEKWIIADDVKISALKDILDKGSEGYFDAHLVRMEVSVDGKIYYLDQKGGVLTGQVARKINVNDVVGFRRSLGAGEVSNIKGGNECRSPVTIFMPR